MTEQDWGDPNNHILGMLIQGRATDEVNERGRPIFGDTILLLVNGGNRSRHITLPSMEESGVWQEIVNTARPEITARVVRTEGLNLTAHSLILARFGEPDVGASSLR
jgi:glycogen operon protein